MRALCYKQGVTRPRHDADARDFAPAWLGGDAAARALLPAGHDDRKQRVAAVERASARRAEPELIAELRRQQAELPPSPSRERNLALLESGGAATVITGQQLGLFGGPAFTSYKAAGAIAAARALSEESGLPCVPVFWLQTEDHDWPEIDHVFVHDRERGAVRVALPPDDVHARVSVATRVHGEGLNAALADLATALAGRPHADEVLALLRRHYRGGAGAIESFRGLLADIFAGDGLLFFDPRRAAVAGLAKPLLERSLVEAEAIAAALKQRGEELRARGFRVQVPVREGAPLCFFHPEDAAGPRYRLEPRGGTWRLCDTDAEVSRDEALATLGREPLRFSSSALLRPLVQDWLFPNAMYVGGPGEIAYFAQNAPLYDLLGVERPLTAPRPSFCVTSAADRRRLETLGLSFDEVAGNRDALLAKLASKDDAFPADGLEARLLAPFEEKLRDFAAHAASLDEALARPVEKARSSIAHTISVLADKYRRSVLLRDSVAVERADKLRAALAPDGTPQERCYGIVSLAAEHGMTALLEAMRDRLEPFDGSMKEIAL